MNILKRFLGKKKLENGSPVGNENAVADPSHLSTLCRQMGDAIVEKIPREQDALIWAHSTLIGVGKPLAEAMQLKREYLPRVQRAGALFLGLSVQIVASPANSLWKGGRPSQHIGQKGRVTEFQFNSVAHREGFSGACFTIELADGNTTRALVEEIEVIGKRQAQKPVTTKSGRGESFQNRYEYDAEYILITGGRYRPGGRYRYLSGTKTEVPNVYFAKYPVTNKRYRRFVCYLEEKERELLEILPKDEFDRRMIEFASGIEDLGEYLGYRPSSWPETLRSRCDTDKRFNAEDQPVVCVSWFAARAYCYWLSLLEAAGENLSYDKAAGLYRLPSEIEWEWAAGGSKRKYPWSRKKGSPTAKLANYLNNVGATTPVGRYPDGATPEGLMDMAGNVSEWMENWYTGWLGELIEISEGMARSSRGGSWLFDDDTLRCSSEGWVPPVKCYDTLGFRVVRSQS